MSLRAVSKHLKDEDHENFVEARLIRESAADGAIQHKRMLTQLLAPPLVICDIALILPGRV